MPVFRDLRLLFVHIPKNAGRSIERALLAGAGTPDGGRRSLANRMAHAAARATRSKFADEYLIGTMDVVVAAQHLTYQEMDLLGLLPAGLVDDPAFEAFCVCRNPFDRAVSSISHFHPEPEDGPPRTPADFERLLLAWLDRPLGDHNERAHRRPQIDYVRDSRGEVVTGCVLRYESLADDFRMLLDRRGRGDIQLPWQGRSKRERVYQDYFTGDARKAVETAFGDDLDAFGYTY
ncbi:MAG: sulfotransferase family 2 domain-containing protein [Pseudomonadota bacterium]